MGANGSFVNYSAELILISYKITGVSVPRPFRAQLFANRYCWGAEVKIENRDIHLQGWM